MTLSALVVICVILAEAIAAPPPGGYYTSKYDSLDVEMALNSKRLVRNYAACLLFRGPCPPQGAEIRRVLPEALQTNCLRCTDKQKAIILTVFRRLRNEYPEIWEELKETWDPTEKYVRRFEETYGKRKNQPPEPDRYPIIDRFEDQENDIVPPVQKPKPTTKVYPSVIMRVYPTTTSASRYIPSITTTATSRRSTTLANQPPSTTSTTVASSSAFASTSKPIAVSIDPYVQSATVNRVSSTTPEYVATSTRIQSTTTERVVVLNQPAYPPVMELPIDTFFIQKDVGISLNGNIRPLRVIDRLGTEILGSISNIGRNVFEAGNKALQVGTSLAGMVVNGVKSFVGI